MVLTSENTQNQQSWGMPQAGYFSKLRNLMTNERFPKAFQVRQFGQDI
jgi:hypothetical protein